MKLIVKLWIMKIMYENCGVKNNYIKEDHHSYRCNFCNLHNRHFVSQVRWTWHFLLSVNTCGRGVWKSQNNGLVMHGSILLETMHPPSLPRHTPWDLQYIFFIGGLFPTAGHTERDNSPTPSSWSTTTYMFFGTSFWSVQKQNDTFSQLLQMFS